MKKLVTLAVGASLLTSVAFAEWIDDSSNDGDVYYGTSDFEGYSKRGTTVAGMITTRPTSSLIYQEIQDNKPDALEFIQTDGQVKSERLNSLMTELRKIDGNQTKSDTELAIDIINTQLEQAE